MRFTPLALMVLCAALLSGCAGNTSNGPDGQSASDEGSLAYNGASAGTQSSKFDCDGSGEASFASNLGSGSVTATMKDSAGQTVYTKSASGPGQVADTKEVQGAAGEWTVSATRGAGFSGQYAVDVDC